jgi:riboflavin kinase, archaea type
VASLELHGAVFTGMGKGAYYVGHPGFQSRFREILGYTPFPGTLNLRLSERPDVNARKRLRKAAGDSIDSFRMNGEEFSSVKCYEGSLNGEEVTLTIPKITEYDDTVLELIAVVKLRDRLYLKDGDLVAVLIDPELIPKANRD